MNNETKTDIEEILIYGFKNTITNTKVMLSEEETNVSPYMKF